MTLKPVKYVPACLSALVILAVCVFQFIHPAFFERLENITYDIRVRQALRFNPPVSTDVGFVFLNEETVKAVHDGSLGYRFGLYWPRQVYGFAIQELAAQKAGLVALDVIFGELRPDHPSVAMTDGEYIESDDFFARELARAGNTILALTREVRPPALFLTNAAAAGDITTEKDADGILRRARAYRDYVQWHSAFRQAEADPDLGLDLRLARVEPGRIVLPRSNGPEVTVPLDADGNFDLADFGGENLPAGVPRKAKPFVIKRAWHMGIVLAARHLGLDLQKAEIDLARGIITLRGPGGLTRLIPVDSHGYFYIDWSLPLNSPALAKESFHGLLADYRRRRLAGPGVQQPAPWKDKLVLIGSAAVLGNDLTDRGATPLEADTLLVSKHWNVANSLLMNRFVRRAGWPAELAAIAVLGALTGLFTARFRVITASISMALLAEVYVAISFVIYLQTRVWVPVVFPLLSVVLVYTSIIVWRVLFEQAEQRRVRSIFSTVVSPKIVSELLRAKALPLGGARREITVLFADVRGFTEFTDTSQARVAEYVRDQGLTGEAAEACYDQQARETLKTVNLYLGLIADTIIKGDGTLDKFMGDCAMAFWGAPAANPGHAHAAVRAAIDAQRAIFQLNRQRRSDNERFMAENAQRASTGLPLVPLLPILELGTGINTGIATVGLMGSEAKTRNYTVFGREVNLASRLEGLSGRSRILISEATYQDLLRDDPPLALTCKCLEPVQVKGIRAAVTVFEVPWMEEVPSLPGPSALSLADEIPGGPVAR